MNELATVDWIILLVTAGSAIVGLFIGFSGSLSFLVSSVVAFLAGKAVWMLSLDYTPVAWMRALATLVAALLVFGIVRWAVRKIVNGLLHQPADAIFGFFVAAFAGAAFSVAAAALARSLDVVTFKSRILEYALAYLHGL